MTDTHPQILDAEFEAGHLKLLTYSPDQISTAIVRNVSRSPKDYTSRQKDAEVLMRWKDPIQILDNIRTFFGIFDDAFFGGLLKGNCTLEVLTEYNVVRRFGRPLIGHSTVETPGTERDLRFLREKPNAHILITAPSQTGTRQWEARLSTLLHEMLHAIFFLYACECHHGSREEDIPLGSHQIFWQKPARAIEVASKSSDAMHYLHLNLSRAESLAHDMHWGFPLPSKVMLEELGLEAIVMDDEGHKVHEVADDWAEKAIGVFGERIRRTSPPKGSACIRGQDTVDGWEQSFGYNHVDWIKFSQLMEPKEIDPVTSTVYFDWWKLFKLDRNGFKDRLIMLVTQSTSGSNDPLVKRRRHFEQQINQLDPKDYMQVRDYTNVNHRLLYNGKKLLIFRADPERPKGAATTGNSETPRRWKTLVKWCRSSRGVYPGMSLYS